MTEFSPPTPAIEAEIQLGLAPAALRRLVRLPLLRRLRVAPGRARNLDATYFDTEDHQFGRHGISLRLRRNGPDEVIQTLKAVRPASAAFGRLEWEAPAAGNVPDLGLFPELDRVPELRGVDLAAALHPVFATRVKRTTWRLRVADGSEIEMAADQGEISCSSGAEAVCEVELELKSGSPDALFDLAAALHREVPLRLLPRTKSERGYGLVDGETPVPRRAEPLHLEREMGVETAFKAIARTCIRHWDASEDAALAGENTEGIHQTRVALRRLRSAMGLFRAVLPPGADDLAAELRWLAGELGPARDWDVFMDEVFNPILQRMRGESSLRRFAQIADTARADGYRRAQAAILSPRTTSLKLALGRWLASPWPGGADLPLGPFADAILARRSRKLRRQGRDLAALAPDQLHDLRIRAKRLRYAAEFFRSLYSKGRVRRHLRALVAVQDVLGAINDGDVGVRLVEDAAARAGAQAQQPWFNRARALIDGWHAASMHAQMRHLPTAWAALTGQRRFWRKVRVEDERTKD